jgi:hypothetical protein
MDRYRNLYSRSGLRTIRFSEMNMNFSATACHMASPTRQPYSKNLNKHMGDLHLVRNLINLDNNFVYVCNFVEQTRRLVADFPCVLEIYIGLQLKP